MWDKCVKNPVCITIFSAPNYCNHENEAAVFLVSPGEKSKVLTYYQSPYSIYYLKNRDDALTIFFPGLVEEIQYMLECIEEYCKDSTPDMLSRLSATGTVLPQLPDENKST